eukprot:UN11077
MYNGGDVGWCMYVKYNRTPGKKYDRVAQIIVSWQEP